MSFKQTHLDLFACKLSLLPTFSRAFYYCAQVQTFAVLIKLGINNIKDLSNLFKFIYFQNQCGPGPTDIDRTLAAAETPAKLYFPTIRCSVYG